MKDFVQINSNWTPETNFWEINPQFTLVNPFAKMYKLDESKNKETSSKYMWAVFFLCYPHESKNILANYPESEKKEYITKNYFPEIDWNDNLFAECLEEFPMKGMTFIQRALKDERDSLAQRAQFLRNTEYSLKTASVLDRMRTNTEEIYENLRIALEKFETEQEEIGRVWGGREESISEQGLL